MNKYLLKRMPQIDFDKAIEFTPWAGEFIVNTTTAEIFIGDGKTKASELKPCGKIPENLYELYGIKQ